MLDLQACGTRRWAGEEDDDDEAWAPQAPTPKVEPCRESNFATFTALHQAAHGGHVDTLEALLQTIDIECKEEIAHHTPLLTAIEAGQYEAVEALLGHNAKVEAKSSAGETALMLAVGRGQGDIVGLLLRHGADPTTPAGLYGYTPMHTAAMQGHLEVLQALAESGADLWARDGVLQTAFHYAVMGEGVEVMKYLLGKLGTGILSATDSAQNFTPMHLAAKEGRLMAIRLLLMVGADQECKDIGGCTPLHLAVMGDHDDVVAQLLKHQINIEAADLSGKTAVHKASEANKLRCLRLLLDKGARIDRVDDMGRTALEMAEGQNHTVAIRMLCAALGHPSSMRPCWRPSPTVFLFASDPVTKRPEAEEVERPSSPRPEPGDKLYPLWCKLQAVKHNRPETPPVSAEPSRKEKLAAKAKVQDRSEEESLPKKSALKKGPLSSGPSVKKVAAGEISLGQCSMEISQELSGTSTVANDSQQLHSRALPHFSKHYSQPRPRSAFTLANDPDFSDWHKHPNYSKAAEEHLDSSRRQTARTLRHGGYFPVPVLGPSVLDKPSVSLGQYIRPQMARR